jgi:hypothetical protein
MIGPDGSIYDIPIDMVRQASRDGFRLHTNTPTMPVPSALQGMEQHPYLDAAVNTAGSLFGGATAGLTNTGRNLANLVLPKRMAISRGPMSTPTPDEMPAYIGEQALEFLAPEALMGKLGKANAGYRALRAAVGTGAVTYGQTGDWKKSLEQAALAGGATPVLEGAGNMMKSAGGWLLNNAMEMSRSVLARSSPGQYAIENGVFSQGWNPLKWPAWSKEGMRNAGEQIAREAMDARDALAAASPQRLSVEPAKQIASEAAARAAADNNETLLNEAGNFYDALSYRNLDITNDKALQTFFPNGMQRNIAGRQFLTAPALSDTRSVSEMLDARQGLASARPWNTNNFFTPKGTALRNKMYGALNEQIHSIPGIQPLDETYNAMSPFGRSIDNKPSLWPYTVVAGAGGAEGGPLGMLKAAAAYGIARSAPGAYALGRTGIALPQIGRGLLNLGFATSDATGQIPNTNPFLHPSDRNMLALPNNQ